MKYVFLSALALLLVGCGTSPIVPYSQSENKEVEAIDYPSSDEVVTKPIGSTLVKKGRMELRDALSITEQTRFNKGEGDSSIWTCALTVEPQTVYLRGQYKTETVEADCYGTVNTRRTLADGSTNFNCPGAPLIAADICKKPDGEVFMAFLSQRVDLKQDFDNLLFEKKAPPSKDNFVQEIVYNGRDGDTLKFIYKEYSDNTNKPSYFQEFQTDMSRSHDVVFKNAKFQIVEANENLIEYRLKENF